MTSYVIKMNKIVVFINKEKYHVVAIASIHGHIIGNQESNCSGLRCSKIVPGYITA